MTWKGTVVIQLEMTWKEVRVENGERKGRRDEQGGKILGLGDYCQVEREEGEGGGKEDITLKE